MTATKIRPWIDHVRRHINNPTLAVSASLDQLESYYKGEIDIASPISPFMALLETTAVNVTALAEEMDASVRRMYPSMARDENDLYLHMSGEDYANRFAQPAMATFVIGLGLDDIYQHAVDEPNNSGVRRLTIPANTTIRVAGISFTMQYPINIRIMPHGGLSVTYDNTVNSPIQSLATNVVTTSTRRLEDVDFLMMSLPIYQLSVQSQIISTNQSQMVSQSFSFAGKFHYARAFLSDGQGQWREIRTTHTDQVYDPTVVTATLKVRNGVLDFGIPLVYTTNGMVRTELRLDIYTTEGPLDIDLGDYTAGQYTATWRDLNNRNLDQYGAALTKITTYSVYSDDKVSGGRDPLSFEELRQRVITNSLGKANVPITSINVGTRLADMGYEMVLDVDNVTQRQFLATRALPPPADGSTISGAGCTMMTLNESMSRLSEHSTVRDNGLRVTILPDTLYQNVNGTLAIVPQPVVDSINQLPVDVRARRINAAEFLYSPFHYVLDMNDDRFDHRPYYLDAPFIETKGFVEQNPKALLSVSMKSYQIRRVPEGYLLTIVVRSGTSWKNMLDEQVYCQLAFTPYGERDRAYQNGTLAGFTEDGERIYTFLINTDYDLDRNHNLMVDSFRMFNDPAPRYPCPLSSTFDVFFCVSGVIIEDFEPSAIDTNMGTNILPVDAIGVTHENLNIVLGKSLDGMWSSSRSVAGPNDYERWLDDVPALYTQTVYDIDPVTGAKKYVIENGQVRFLVLHEIGDPVLDDQQNPVIKHYAGDVKLDSDGQPIVRSTRQMVRQIDLYMVDGIYWFADDAVTSAYRQELADVIVGWLENDIATVQSQLLEKTRLYFYPKSSMGNVAVRVLEGRQIYMSAPQRFAVTFYLNGSAYSDAALRTALKDAAARVINNALQSSTVTMSDIVTAMRNSVMGDAIGVSVTGLGGSTPYDTVTLLDNSARLSVRKKAVAGADGTISVEDDIDVAYVRHTD